MKYFKLYNSAEDSGGAEPPAQDPPAQAQEPKTEPQEPPAQQKPPKPDKADKEEMAAFKAWQKDKENIDKYTKWKESQQTEAERQAKRDKEYADLQVTNRNLEIKAAALEAGIPKSLLKYAMVDIGEAEDIESGIAAFMQSDLFKSMKQTAHDLGANTPPTSAPASKSAQFQSRLAEARKNNNTAAAILIKQEAAKAGITLL